MPENERESDHIEGNGIHFRNLDYLRLVNSRCKVQDGCAGGPKSYIFCAFDNGIFPGCKNRPLEDLRHSDFSHVPGRFLLSVRTKSKIENLVH